jgi:hypothetical protein
MAGDDQPAGATSTTQYSTDRMRYLITITIAVVLLLAFGLFVYYLTATSSSLNELAWERRVYLFGGVEAIVFTAVGWIFGREVNRGQVDAAENRAKTSEQKADTATSEAAEANAAAADLAARGEAAKAAVLARNASLSNPQNVRTRSIYGDKAAEASTELEDLASFMPMLYPDK